MKKLLTCLLVVGALALTAVPASASIPNPLPSHTLWHSPKAKLTGAFGCDGPCQCLPSWTVCTLFLTWKNRTPAEEWFRCHWNYTPGVRLHWSEVVEGHATTGTVSDGLRANLDMHCRVTSPYSGN
jgi:hypothetical protein